MKRQTRQSGFTIIELLVATSVALLMGFMINIIFFETTNAVTRGISLSRMVAETRTIGDQFALDADETSGGDQVIVGPVSTSEDGFLVIVNHKVDGPLRIIDSRFDGPVTYTDDFGYGGAPLPIRSDQIAFIRRRVAAGQRLQPLCPANTSSFSNSFSSDTEAEYARVWYGHLHRTAPDGTPPSVSPSGFGYEHNLLVNRWVLGRQALFFDDPPSPVHIDYDDGFIVKGYGTPWNDFYYGESDILNISYVDAVAELDATSTETAYRQEAYKYIFRDNRLCANPYPLLVDPTDEDKKFMARQIGQMHAYFAAGVADFIVQFAADAVDDLPAGAPDGAPDGRPDTDADGNLIWYDMDNPPTWDSTAFPGYDPHDVTSSTFADEAFVFRHDDDGADSKWPYLIRIRYRLLDPDGELGDVNEATNQTETGKWFEHVIRVPRP